MKNDRLTIRVTDEDHASWKKAAAEEGMTLTGWIEMLAKERLAVLKAQNSSKQ